MNSDILEWYNHLENWWITYHAPYHDIGFTEWFDKQSNSDMIMYLQIGKDCYEQWLSEQ